MPPVRLPTATRRYVTAASSLRSSGPFPQVGDCRREERQGGTAWRQCFDTQSRWLITWVRQVHHATVATDACTIATVPVLLEESRDAWWLWWVPHPHLDNSTLTHFTMTLRIDSANCIPAVLR
jgi:hypothetical protein